jgi:glucose/arabinose dehydrogenase
MLRIDVSGDSGYTNPTDNAFPGGVGGRPEIYAYGLRNPWRDSFDRATGDFYIADVGEGAREEVNFLAGGTPGGQNYGWRVYEGTQFTGLETGPTTGLTFPIHEYDHSVGSSITGGYVYRGLGIPGLQGDYFFGDFISGRIWTGERSGDDLINIVERTTQLGPTGGGQTWGNRLASFGEDASGELYLVGLNGAVYRIIPEPGTWALVIAALVAATPVIRRKRAATVPAL